MQFRRTCMNIKFSKKWKIILVFVLAASLSVTIFVLLISSLCPQTSFIYNNKYLCSSESRHNQRSIISSPGEPTSIVIVVPSCRGNFLQRNLVRRTWGSIRNINRVHIIAVVFMLGGMDAPDEWKADIAKLEAERSQFGDIIMGDFVDSYRNLTLKAIMMYDWLMSFCQEADLVVKTDDDVMVNIFTLTEELCKWTPTVLDSLSLWCGVHCLESIIRDESSSYYVSPEEYSGTVFPPHCAGVGYVITMSTIRRIRKEISTSFQGAKCTHEDVFMTGIVTEKINSAGNEKIVHFDKITDWIYYILDYSTDDRYKYLIKLLKQPSNETFDANEFKKQFKTEIFYLIDHGPDFEQMYERMWQLVKIAFREETEMNIKIRIDLF